MSDEINETRLLRQAWVSSAQQILTRLQAGQPVKPNEINELQKSLENIEAREAFEEARELTRG